MLKFEDLKVGDKVECLDIDLYLNLDDEWKEPRLKIIESSLIVDRIYDGSGLSIKDCELCIPVSDFKYFKKKEQSQYTFDDLIDVAVQAYKDRVIGNLFIGDTYVDFDSGNDRYGYDITCLSSGINFIKSLYKETFVIECEEDIARIKIDADVTLANGLSAKCVSCQTRDIDRTVRLDCKSADDIFGIFVLKGAKVEQAKG